MRNSILLIIFFMLIFSACDRKPVRPVAVKDAPLYEISEINNPEWINKSVIYEINLQELTQNGTFYPEKNYLSYLKNMGVNVLLINPVQKLSNFKELQRFAGTTGEFKLLIERAHCLGLKVLLDWNPKFVSKEHSWAHNSNNRVSFNSQDSLYEINYNVLEVRKAMTDAMLHWVSSFDIDGFRCLHTEDVPLEFWSNVRKEIENLKPILLVTDSENPQYIQSAFNACYSRNLFYIMDNILNNKQTANDLSLFIKRQDTIPYSFARINFISTNLPGHGPLKINKAIELFTVLSFILSDIPSLYSDQENGYKNIDISDSLFQRKENHLTKLITRLCMLKQTNLLLSEGSLVVKNTSAKNNLLCISRKKDDNEILFIANASPYILRNMWSENERKAVYTDFVNSVVVTDLPSVLYPWEYRIYIK